MVIDRLPHINEQLMFSVKRASEVLNWNERKIWIEINSHREAVRNGECTVTDCDGQCGIGLASLRSGNRVFVTREALKFFIKFLKKTTPVWEERYAKHD